MSDHPQFATEYLSLRNMVAKNRSAESLTDAQLIHLGEMASDPASPSACIDWAEREAVPLLHELAKRLKALHSGPWFCFDGCDFERHESKAAALGDAEKAMESWEDAAGDGGWDEESDQVCCGPIAYAVRVERLEADEEELELYGVDYIAAHHFEPVHKGESSDE